MHQITISQDFHQNSIATQILIQIIKKKKMRVVRNYSAQQHAKPDY